MRTIKFRGKCIDPLKDKQKWVYGYYAKILQDGHLTDFIYDSKNWYEIISGSQCQYTGKKDVNGDEIYDKDILGFCYGIPPTKAILEVYWNVYDMSWGVKCHNAKPRTQKLSWFFKHDTEIEIIGNTTDNPELLKEKK